MLYALATALQELIRDPTRRRRIASMGLERALAVYSQQRVVDDTYALYQKMIAARDLRERVTEIGMTTTARRRSAFTRLPRNSAIMPLMQVERPRAALNAQLLRINEGYRSAGIARYMLHLLREAPAAASDFDLDVFSTEPLAPQRLPGVTIRTTRMKAHKPLTRILWEQSLFALQLLQKNYALLHSLAYVSPLFNRTPSIVTIYDLRFYLYPEYFRPFHRLYLPLGTRISVRRGTAGCHYFGKHQA